MNPSIVPPEQQNKPSFSSQLALASLAAPLLAIGIKVLGSVGFQGSDHSSQAMLILELVALALIVVGIFAGIFALAGIPTHGTRGILGRGITGLVLNCLLMLIAAANLFVGYSKKTAQSRATFQHLQSSADDLSSNLKNNFDPKKGITNVDLGKMDRLRNEMKSASTNLSGEDAQLASVMAAYFDRIGNSMKNYEAAVNRLRVAQVMSHFDSADKDQFAPRREIVQHFLQANSAIKNVIVNAEDSIRADLIKAHLSEAHIQNVMDGYHSSAAPLNTITLKIRECDDKLGNAMLDAFNTLESSQGHWRFDAAKEKLIFSDEEVRLAYNKSINAINAAAQEQVKWQSKLIAVQESQRKERAEHTQRTEL
jgi:hypothetical protein